MAQIDPSIALQFKQPQIQDPINQFAKAQELNVNALKMNEMQRGIESQNKLRELFSQGIDVGTPEGFKQLAAVDPATAMKLRTDALQAEKLKGEIKETGLKITAKDMDIAREGYKNLQFNPSDNNFKSFLEDSVLSGKMTPTQAQQQFAEIAPLSIDQRREFIKNRALKAEQLFSDITQRRGQDITASTAIRGQDLTASTARRGQDITLQGQEMQYNPDLQAKIAEAKAAGEFMGKNKATAAAALPGALEAAKEGIRLIDEMVGQAEVRDKSGKVITKGTKPHPGFSEYVGGTLMPGKRFLEGTDVAGFEVRQKQIEGKAFLEAFQTLKGGGAITEKEGEKGTAAIMRMNKASNEKEYVAAARELQTVLRSGMERARTKAGDVAPSGGGGGVVDYNSLN
jgi:hypothetical protein